MKNILRNLFFLLGLLFSGNAAYSNTGNLTLPRGETESYLYSPFYLSNLCFHVIVPPADVPVCSGQVGGVFKGDLVAPAPLSYTWQIFDGSKWIDAPGIINTADYPSKGLTNTTTADVVYQIRRKVTATSANGGGISFDSPYDVTVSPTTPISNNSVSAATTIYCTSGDPYLTGSAPAGSNGAFTYQWQSSTDGSAGSYTDIPGATTQSYDPGLIQVTTWYHRVVSSNSCVIPSISNPVKITIEPAISNNSITSPSGATFCTPGNPGTIQGSLVAGGNGTYNYQWQRSTDNGVTFSNISGATGVNYSAGALLVTTSYQRVVTTGGCVTPSVSNSITITVYPKVDNSTNTLTPPAVSSFCVQGDAEPIIGSVPTGGNGTYAFHWQSSSDQKTWADINAPDGTGQDYDPPLLTATTYYRRTVSSGACLPPSVSAAVAITVLPAITNNGISLNPNPVICSYGSIASIIGQTPKGGDGTYTYQWQSSGDDVTFADIAQATNKDLPPSQLSGTSYYRREVTSGVCNIPAVSNIVTVLVQPAIANNAITLASPAHYCLTADAAPISGSVPTGGDGINYAYQWQSSADNVTFTDITGENGQNYNRPAITKTTYYRRNVTSGSCTIPNISSVVTIVVYQQVAGNNIMAPAVAEFCVTGTPEPITGAIPTNGDTTASYAYQWQSSATGVAGSFQNLPGETRSDLSFIQPLTVTMYYQRLVTSGICTIPVASNIVKIMIDPLVTRNTINQAPGGPYCNYTAPTIIVGGLPAGGNGVFVYQWQRSVDGVSFENIPGNAAQQADYTPDPISQTTYFRRMVSSGVCPSIPSIQTAVYKIVSTPSAPAATAVAPICAGTTALLVVTNPDSAFTYFWYDSNTASDRAYLAFGTQYPTDILSASKVYYVSANNGSCFSARTPVQVTVNPTPDAPALVNSDASACYNSPITLDVAAPKSTSIYKWYNNASGGIPFFTGSSYLATAVVTDLDFYVEETNSSGCVSASRSHQHVTATPALQIIANGQDGVCPGSSATITATATDPDATINWYLTATGGSSIGSGSPFLTPVVNANTTFWAEAVGSVNGCISPKRVPANVTVLSPLDAPVVTVTNATSSSITFSWQAVSGAAVYQVSIDGGATFTNSTSGGDGLTTMVTDLKPDQSITLIVKAEGNAACQASATSMPVTGTATNPVADQLYVANAFTPNGDGNNDIVYVHNEKIKSMKFYVYDQWGELLYSSFNQQNGWDGTFKGKKEPVGVYVYFVEAVLTDGKQVKKKGTITLLR